MSTKKTSNVSRTRTYASVVYPESAPDRWQEILADCCIPAFISPLHDEDIDPLNQPKKPHFHVMLLYEGPKTREQACEVFSLIGGVGCEAVQSIRGYARYLCHLDNPEKHQYSPQDVKAIAGADYFEAIDLPTDRRKALKEMMSFCSDNDIHEFCDLADWASDNRSDWFVVLCDSGSIFMREYLKSKRFKHGLKK